MKISKFWDVLVLGDDGRWVGFRAPLKNVQRFGGYFAIILIICSFSIVGWLFSRWESERLSRDLFSERLKAAALEAQLNDIKSGGRASVAGIDASALEAFTLFPSLDAEELSSSTVELKEDEAEIDLRSNELVLDFELVRKPPREGSARYYWIALLHGSQGVLSFPEAVASRNGDPLLFHRGLALDDVRTRRNVSARFKVNDFVNRASTDPIFTTLLVYDNKGSLLVRKRYDLNMRRSSLRGQ